MNRLRALIALASGIAAAGCGSSPDPKSSDDAVADAPRSTTQLASQRVNEPEVSERCVERKDACMPPITWAKTLCEDVYEDLALYMFRDGTPWTRFYVRRSINAVNGWGPTLHEDLRSSEEVLVINHRLSRNSMEVEGSAGTYDVLRWNGSCVTLDVNQVTKRPPSKPRNSSIEWLALSEEMRTTLMQDEEVAASHELRRKACRGASVGRASDQCEDIDEAFMHTVAKVVRHTRDLPHPSSLP